MVRCGKCFTEGPSEEAVFCWKCGESMQQAAQHVVGRSGSIAVPMPLTPLKKDTVCNDVNRQTSPTRDRGGIPKAAPIAVTPPAMTPTPVYSAEDRSIEAILERARLVNRTKEVRPMAKEVPMETDIIPQIKGPTKHTSPERSHAPPSPFHPVAPVAVPVPVPVPVPVHPPVIANVPHIVQLPTDCIPKVKSDALFDELDLRGAGRVALDDLRTALTRCGLVLDPIDIAEIFRKADIDRDTLLTLSEFQILTDSYPSLTDALFRRTRIYWTETEELREIEAARIHLEVLKSQEQSERSIEEAERKEDTLENERLREAESALAAEETLARQVRNKLEVSTDEIDMLHSQGKETTLSYQVQSDRVTQRDLLVQDSKRETELQEKALAGQAGVVQKSRIRLKELEMLLVEQEEEVKRQDAKYERCKNDVVNAKKREEANIIMLEELQRETESYAARLQGVEDEIAKQESYHRALECQYKQAEADTQRVATRRDETLQHIQWARERRSQQKKAALHVKTPSLHTVIEEQQRLIIRLTQQHEEKKATNKADRDKETAVINMELRLRRQRQQLEEEEHVLAAGRQPASIYSPRAY